MGAAQDVSSRINVRAETIVDNDGPGRPGLFVAVTVNPSAVIVPLIGALAALVGDVNISLVLVLPPSDPRYIDALERICRDPAVQSALTIVHSQDQAEALAEELTAAAQTPDDCIGSEWCDGYAQHPSGLCDACEDRT